MREGPGFALIDEDGVAFYVADTYDEAMSVATKVAPRADVWYEGPPPWEGDEEPEAMALAANVGGAQTEPERALYNLGIEPMSTDQILSLSVDSAFNKIRQFFPTAGQGKEKSITYDTPESMAKHFFGTNYKLEKQSPGGFAKASSTGLNLLPSNSWTFENAKEVIALANPVFGVQKVKLPTKGATVCASASKQCRESCLVFSARNTADYPVIKKLALTMSLFNEPLAFMRMVYAATSVWVKECLCEEADPYLRLNVYSDIPWELLVPDMFDHFHNVRYYDYTKVSQRMNLVGGKIVNGETRGGRYPIKNYDLTFSYSGTPANIRDVDYEVRRNRRRVAVTFATIGTSRYVAPGELIPKWPARTKVELPKAFMGLPVIDGDLDDFRPLNPSPCVVGLRWKTPAGMNITAKKAEIFIVPGYLVDESGAQSEEGTSFVVMDLPRYKDVFGSGASPRWSSINFGKVSTE
jgi:hypothetical protein